MIAAALLAFAIKPHNLMARTHDMFDIDAHVPHAFGDWAALPGVQAVRPSPDGLEAEIYNQEASRAYVDKEGHVIMLMIAYGESQSERLQLHHPEVCYEAEGFRVTRPVTLTFDWSASAPPIVLTRLVATREDRLEPISYWMRIGYDVTYSNWARNALKLEYGLKGWNSRRGALSRFNGRPGPGHQLQGAGHVHPGPLERRARRNASLHGRRSHQGAPSFTVSGHERGGSAGLLAQIVQSPRAISFRRPPRLASIALQRPLVSI